MRSSLADELVEEGLLTCVGAADGSIEYFLTERGARFVDELLERSPTARDYLHHLQEREPDANHFVAKGHADQAGQPDPHSHQGKESR
jgi:hypothetical protein